MALTKVSTPAIKDEAITLAKLLHGDSNSNGKFLRANNGADPTFETVNTDLVSDTSPQLGGDLASNGNDILLADNDKAIFGTGADLKIYHNGSHNYFLTGNGDYVFDTGSAELARLTRTNGFLGIGEPSPDRKLHITDSSFAAIRLENSSTSIADGTNICALEFSHADSSAAGVGAGILAAMSNTSTGALDLIFKTGTGVSTYQENMRLTGAGFLGIGMTPAAPLHVTGATADTLRLTNGGNASIYYKIGRNHADGKLEFRGTQSGDECYSFGGVSGEKIRFQPAGGISFNGDTAAANALDDYEEGTWTPSITGGAITNNAAYYTKIGRVVTWYLYGKITNTANNNQSFQIQGLPFTVLDGNYYGNAASFNFTQTANNAGLESMGILAHNNSTYVYFHFIGRGDTNPPTHSYFHSHMLNQNFIITGSYYT